MKHIVRLASFLLGWIWITGAAGAGPEPAAFGPPDLAARFADPPAAMRIQKIIHGWPDDPAAQDGLIARLGQLGFGGVVCNLSFDQYLASEPKWQAFDRAVKAAKQAGMAMWLYDERGYPSGNAGGLTLRDHPEWEARGLLVAGVETGGGAVALDLPPGKPVLTAAFPLRDGRIVMAERVDLAQRVKDGKLAWDAPAGSWHVMAVTEDSLYEGTHAAGNLHAKIPYINLLQAQPTARFLELTHQAYARRLGDDLSGYFMGLFTDEPSLMSLFLRPMPYRPLPWAAELPAEFAQRRGYPLDAAVLPALIADAGPAGEKIRHDFWLTVGELVADNFFGQIQTWGREHKIPSGGHLLLEENIVGHVPLYGDFFRCIRRLDAPSIDCLTSLPSEVPWQVARLLGSAAELGGHPLVMSETSDHVQRYRPPGDTRPVRVVSEAEMRGTCNRLMVGGVNNITSYYSYAELADDQVRRLNEWVGRCCLMLRGGCQVADIGVVYPVESIWTKFSPSRNWTSEAPAAARIEAVYRAAIDSLFETQRDFTFLDSRALLEAGVETGDLVHGSLRWRVVVLPGVDTLPLAAWEKLAQFVRSGGVVIALGAWPANSEREFPCARVRELAREMFGGPAAESPPPGQAAPPDGGPRFLTNKAGGAGIHLPTGSESLLPLVLGAVIGPDVKVSDAKAPVRVTHRRLNGGEVYFVINDSAEPWQGELAIAAEGDGQQWDPASGRVSGPIKPESVVVALDGYGATILRFPAARRPARLTPGGDSLPGLTMQAIPPVTPAVGKGEFVHGGVGPDAAHSTAARAIWLADATLTKGGVDTHLFTSFDFPQPLDLSGAACLVLESLVPERQRAAGQLLVILHEQGGGDFLAESGRSLAVPGWQRSYLPISQFKLAGWSKDGDGRLDLARVGAIRVGWGGYFGNEGETVRFSIAQPGVARIKSSTRPSP